MVKQIDVHELQRLLAAGQRVHLLDVRHAWEHDIVALPNSQLVPLPELPGCVDEIQVPGDALLVVYCHHGIRSLSAARFLEQAGLVAVSLSGGIDAWARFIDPTMTQY